MRDIPKYYNGKNITNNLIKKIKFISKNKYDETIYNNYFKDINTLDDLCDLHDTCKEDENLILGKDWFIMYSLNEYKLEVLEWVALDNENKFVQVSEMLNAFKKLLLLSKGKYITSFMRHDTSYKFYTKFIKKGYLKEYYHSTSIDFCRPFEMEIIIDKLKEKYNTIEEYLNNNSNQEYTKYEKYILHNIDFGITKKFIKKYK